MVDAEKASKKGLSLVRNMKVLYIVKRGPYNIAAQTHLKVLKEIYGQENIYVVDLLSSKNVQESRFVSYGYNSKKVGERLVRFLQGNSPFISNRIIADMCGIIRNNDIKMVFSEESDLGNLYKKIKLEFGDVKVICFFHDISADLFKNRIKDAPLWKQHYIQECKNIIRQEKVTQQFVDEKWVFNQADADRYFAHYGCNPDEIIPMGAPAPESGEEYKSIITGVEQKKKMLFVCSSYYVNIEGFKWFYQNVLPKLKKKYHIVIVGGGAQQLKPFVMDEDVEIHGHVDSMSDYYETADIVIEPVFDGGGMKVKTIEALSFGKMIISTSESLNGYWEAVPNSLKDKLIFRCNTATEWIDACNKVMNMEIKRYNSEVFDVFNKNFSDKKLLEVFCHRMMK